MLLHESEVKPRMSANNKDIIRMYLGYINWLITQKTLPITSGYVHLSKLPLSFTIDFFLGDIYLLS